MSAAGGRGPTLLEFARQALSGTDAGYDLLASKFDLTPFRTPDVILDTVRARLHKDPAPTRALDVCCGTGAATRMLRDLATEHVVGLDRSEGMLAEARTRLAADAGVPFSLVRGDARSIPAAGGFDLAVSFGAFGHIEPRDEASLLASVRRALLPGGRFVFVTTELPPLTSRAWWMARGFNAAMRVRNALLRPPFIMYYLTFLLPEVESLLNAAGFTVELERLPVQVSSLSPDQRALWLVLATRRE